MKKRFLTAAAFICAINIMAGTSAVPLSLHADTVIENDFEDGISYPWFTYCDYSAAVDYNTSDGML